jgi:hypothetical protein
MHITTTAPRLRSIACLLAVLLGVTAINPSAFAQVAGDACVAGQVSGPDALGNNLICSGGVFVVGGSTPDRIVSGTTNVIATNGQSVTITTAGSQRMIVGANGNVGIGTTTPSGTLRVGNVIFYEGALGPEINGNNNSIRIQSRRAIDGSTVSAGNTFINPTSGFVGIGTVSATEVLTIQGSTGAGIGTVLAVEGRGNSGTGRGSAMIFRTPTSGGAPSEDSARLGAAREGSSGNSYFIVETSQGATLAEKLRITSAGNVGIGTTAPAARLDIVSSTAGVAVLRAENGTGACTYTPDSSGGGTWACSSDRKLKKDIVDAPAAYPWLDGFRIRDFTMRSDGSRQTGVIAQELQETHPEMVTKDADGTLMVAEPNSWKLVKALQELKAANDNLQQANAELKADLKDLRAAFDHMRRDLMAAGR